MSVAQDSESELGAGKIGVGVIGTGFMGKAHAMAYRAVAGVFPEALRPVLQVVADIDPAGAERAREQFQFQRGTIDWRTLVDDAGVEVVSITTPSILHREMALAAIAAGKHVHCEKPLAPDAHAAKEMMHAAESAGVVTAVGFNYVKNPLIRLAHDMVAAGELGEITNFRGIHAEDYMSDTEAPYTWRLDPSGGAGAISDIGSHIIGMARFLLGPIHAVSADLETVVTSRPVRLGAQERRPVEVDDIARVGVRFARGCSGTIEANWMATGRKMYLAFELTGTKGSLLFNQERLNELQYFRAGGVASRGGFVRIEAGPEHDPYGRFCVAPGHQLGFNDLKTIEVADFLSGVAGGERRGPDFREAWEIQKVIDTSRESAKSMRWCSVE